MPRNHRSPAWFNPSELSLGLGTSSPPPSSLRLTLRALLFTDQLGNVVIVDPHREKPLGARALDRRQPSLYIGATETEIEAALSEMTWIAERWLVCGKKQLALMDRAREARRRLDGFVPSTRLPKVA
jgi:hypothetical protein